MPRNGSGVATLAQAPFVPNTPISSSAMNSDLSDIANMLTGSVASDGQTTITGQLKGASGSVGLPSYSFSANTNMGMYRHGAGELGFSTNGTAAGYFDIAQKFWMLGAADIAGLLNVTGVATFSSTANLNLPAGTTGQRPGTPTEDMFRYNTTTHTPEFYNGSSWVAFAAAPVVPNGRLTLTSGTAVLVADASAQSTVYYTPYNGNEIPIYDGTSFNNNTFTELSMVMSGANFAASTIYDLFVAIDSGGPTLRLAIGPAWTTSTAGSGNRGTGAGTTQLQRLNGIWTNAVSITLRYASASTFTAAVNQATYVGSILMDGTNSQTSCLLSYGQTRRWGIWNAYNREPIMMKAGDPTANWTYASGTQRESNGSSSNVVTVLEGLAEEFLDLSFSQLITTGGINRSATIGIGWNSTTTISGLTPIFLNSAGSSQGIQTAAFIQVPSLGQNNVVCIESAPSANSSTFFGQEAQMVLAAKYRG